MKTVWMAVIAFALSTGASKAENTTLHNAKKTTVSATASATALSDENTLLKAKVEQLSTLVQELESSIDYEKMMSSMFQQIAAERQSEKNAEFEAAAAYNRLMANMWLRLQASL